VSLKILHISGGFELDELDELDELEASSSSAC